jgi:hypothetical protein
MSEASESAESARRRHIQSVFRSEGIGATEELRRADKKRRILELFREYGVEAEELPASEFEDELGGGARAGGGS